MLNYKDYFDDLLKINSQLSYIINKTSNFKHYTNTLSNEYISKIKKLVKKYEKTTDLELKKTIFYIKKYLTNKIYLYYPITSYENDILTFENDNIKKYPPKYKTQRQKDFHNYLKTIIMRLDEASKLKIFIPYIIVKKILLQIKKIDKYKYLYDYLKNTYKSTKKIGLCNLPKGKYIYKLLVKETVDKTPEYVHKLGLSLLPKKISSKKSNKYFKSKEELFKECVKISLYIYNNIIDKYFYYKPDKPFTIKKVPSNLEDSFPMAYYTHVDDAVFINLKYYKECTKQSLYSLLMHECFHEYHYKFMNYHKLEKYQIYGYNNLTMIEGFAHYMEIYSDDIIDNFNNQTKEDDYYTILRKLRLVVDTGINYYNWSYKKAFNFMSKYLPNNTDDIINEIDRYICIPSQSLCYVIGKMEIINMRDEFLKKNKHLTIKDFHQKLLINGTCSLSTIKKLIL